MFCSLVSKFLLIVVVLATVLSPQVANASVFGIGARLYGDQLLMRDIVKTPSITLTEETVITFNYAIPQPITHIEMLSEEDIYVSVDFSYENDLVNGTIRKEVPGITVGSGKNHEPFEVLIQIYGYNEPPQNLDLRYILNRGQQMDGFVNSPAAPPRGKPQETLSLRNEDSEILEHFDEEEDNDIDIDAPVHNNHGDDDGDDDDDFLFNTNMNKIIQLGNRQEGDRLLYHADQTSPEETETPSNHTVMFYYIDNNFITFVEFNIIDHYLERPLTPDYQPPTVVFEKISPHTLKAIVTDQHTTGLFVQMQIYGYEPNDKPVAFQSYLTSAQASSSSTSAADDDDDEHDVFEDLEQVRIELPLTAKRRTRVQFNKISNEGPEDTITDCSGGGGGGGYDGVGHLVTSNNWLIAVMTGGASVAVMRRHIIGSF